MSRYTVDFFQLFNMGRGTQRQFCAVWRLRCSTSGLSSALARSKSCHLSCQRYQNYAQGEWLVARRMLREPEWCCLRLLAALFCCRGPQWLQPRMETKDLLGVEDGPSVALLRYMEDGSPAFPGSHQPLCMYGGSASVRGTEGLALHEGSVPAPREMW